MTTPPNTHPEPAVPPPEGYELRPQFTDTLGTDLRYNKSRKNWEAIPVDMIGCFLTHLTYGQWARKIVPEPDPSKSAGEVVYEVCSGCIYEKRNGALTETALSSRDAADILNSHATVKRQRDALLTALKDTNARLEFYVSCIPMTPETYKGTAEGGITHRILSASGSIIKEVEETA